MTTTIHFGPMRIDRRVRPISVKVPAAEATYPADTTVLAAYSCTDAEAGISTCNGPVANGAAIDMSVGKNKTFKIYAPTPSAARVALNHPAK